MDSWSQNRSKEGGPSKAAKLEKIGQVNAVLRMLANDADLQDDLKTKEVIIAVNHWTGQKRLSNEEASKFQDHRRVLYVLQKFQVLQHVCKEAGTAVPLDHLMTGQKELSNDFIVKVFGSEFDLSKHEEKVPVKKSDVSTTKPKVESVKPKESAPPAVVTPESVPTDSSVSEIDNATSSLVDSNNSKNKALVAEEIKPVELTEKQKKIIADRKLVRRFQEFTVVLVILVCIFMKWYFD